MKKVLAFLVCAAISMSGCGDDTKKESPRPSFKAPAAGMTQISKNNNIQWMINNETVKLVEEKAPIYQLNCTLMVFDANMSPRGKQQVGYRYNYSTGELEFNPALGMGGESRWKKFAKADANNDYCKAGLVAFKTAFAVDFPFGNGNGAKKAENASRQKANTSAANVANGIAIPEGYDLLKTEGETIKVVSKVKNKVTGGAGKIYDETAMRECTAAARNCFSRMKIIGGIDDEVLTIYKDGRMQIQTAIGDTVLTRYYKNNRLVMFGVSQDPGLWAVNSSNDPCGPCNSVHKLSAGNFTYYAKIGLREIFASRWS